MEDRDAEAVRRWAEALGTDRSEHDGNRWVALPLHEDEFALSEIAVWGPAEDWSDL